MNMAPPDNQDSIKFHAHWLPALAAGEYEVSVAPQLVAHVEKKKGEKPSEEKLAVNVIRQSFHVGGPRFSLTGREAYSCYPAPDQKGSFDGTLPHIVFDRCTLPWERTIGQDEDSTKPHDPWLALILLTDSDFASANGAARVPALTTTTLKELTEKKPDGNVIGPEITLEPYEDKEKDSCQTIDLPFPVFRKVMPAREDLQYLAHVREVKTGNKETWSLLKEGRFSVVVCNRFPETQIAPSAGKDWGIVNTACLVSLEGWGGFLADAKRQDPPDPGQRTRGENLPPRGARVVALHLPGGRRFQGTYGIPE
jgi:hypothetical protein